MIIKGLFSHIWICFHARSYFYMPSMMLLLAVPMTNSDAQSYIVVKKSNT